MNEGKPTKAKWWSRQRAQGTGTGLTPDHMATERASSGPQGAPGSVPDLQDADGPAAGSSAGLSEPAASAVQAQDGGTGPAASAAVVQDGGTGPAAGAVQAQDGVSRPAAGAAVTARAEATDVAGGGGGGDFELRRPDEAVPCDGAVAARTGHGGDFELARPATTAAHTESRAVARQEPDDDGDFELERPRPIPEAGMPQGSPAGAPGEAGAHSEPGAGRDAARADTPAGLEAGRPRPLHDPDPYSTPPYGEPGPWAPAPPVQHPGTPAHGTAVPPTPPPHGAPATVQAPAPAPPGPAVEAPHAAPATTPPPQDPWRNYDPWAVAPGPLQQNGAAVLSKEQRRRRVRKTLVLGAALLALVSGGIGGAVGAYLERNGGLGDVELPQSADSARGRAPDSVAGIAAKALPGVVTLHVSGADAQGTGTGFLLDKRGHILTNNHVVEPAGDGGEISVTFSGGETSKATIVGRDSGYDLAVVKVTGVSGLKPLPLGNSDDVQVGDPVVAIGAPFDLANTVTSGIISAKERPITAGGQEGDGSDVSYVDALQTDAPINPGNSGGPLVDAGARVIGINSAIRSAGNGSDPEGAQAGSIGLGFAIPINQGKRVAEELINTGRATHPVIGVTLDMDYSGDGARVGTEGNGGRPPVNTGGPGDKAGIKSGDVITEVDGQRVHSGEELIVKIRAHRPGDRLELTLQRDGRARKVTLTLGSSGG